MPNHRMLSLRIVRSGNFLALPIECRDLYVQMVMGADDDGVVEIAPLMKMLGTPDSTLKILMSLKYVLPLDGFTVIVITDWREHNSIRADRKIDSFYINLIREKYPQIKLKKAAFRADVVDKFEELATRSPEIGEEEQQLKEEEEQLDVQLKEEEEQQITAGRPDKPQQNDEKEEEEQILAGRPCTDVLRQDRLVQGSASELRKSRSRTTGTDFDSFWDSYPRKQSKKEAIRAWHSISVEDRAIIISRLEIHKQSDQWKKEAGRFIPLPATWLRGERWKDEMTVVNDAAEKVVMCVDCGKEKGMIRKNLGLVCMACFGE